MRWSDWDRTDLAVERAAMVKERTGEIPGLYSTREQINGIEITRVHVSTPQAASQVGKPPGRYFTLECSELKYRNRALLKTVAQIISHELAEMADLPRKNDILIVGLGNWQATPDALGPRVVSQLMVTRHVREYIPKDLGGRLYPVAAVSPGVLGITGMETVDIVKGIVDQIRPELVITVDALAARSPTRLFSTVQIGDTGIQPGSGVGNKRPGINLESLGVPVVAVGVPTVVSGASIAVDVLHDYFQKFNPHARPTLDSVHQFLSQDITDLLVTHKDVDLQILEISKLLASAINKASQPAISEDEMLDYLQ